MDNFKDKKADDILEKLVHINRITKVVKGGRRFGFSALVVVGNQNGKIGIAHAKAKQVPDAIKKATEVAKRNLIKIPLKEGRTLHHDVEGKNGSGKVFLRAAPAGTGIIAGGALGIALAGDYRIANKSTKLLSAHFKRGFVPAGGATYLLPRLIGLARTQTLFFGGKTLNSNEMLEWGLVHEVVEDEYLNENTMKMAHELANGPTSAIAETKKLLIDSDTLSLKQELEREREKNRDSGNSGDAVEGIKAFIEKREPNFE